LAIARLDRLDQFQIALTDPRNCELVTANFLIVDEPIVDGRTTAFVGRVSPDYDDRRVLYAEAEVEVRRCRRSWEIGERIMEKTFGIKPSGAGVLSVAIQRNNPTEIS